MQVHLSGCPLLEYSNLATAFTWAEGKTREQIERYVGSDRLSCPECEPLEAVFGDGGIFYDRTGNVISLEQARDWYSNFSRRCVKVTKLQFWSRDFGVHSTFVPIDHSDTHGRYTRHPACWITEIVGGPPDLDGTTRYSRSEQSCLELHDEIVALAVAAGCIEVDDSW